MTPTAELDVIGVPVDLIDEDGALDRLLELHGHDRPRFVSYVNPHTANLAFADPEFRSVLLRAGLRLPDGFGIRFAGRRQGIHVRAILNGTDFNETALRHLARHGIAVFLLGGRPGVPEAAAARLGRRIPGLRVAGTHHGYFDDDAVPALAARIRISGASALVVALGQPRQELWLASHLHETGARLGLAVGGFLDFSAGVVPRAPAWMNRAGIEWVFRLALEPRRLARRYLLGNPLYVWRVALQRRPRPGRGRPAALGLLPRRTA